MQKIGVFFKGLLHKSGKLPFWKFVFVYFVIVSLISILFNLVLIITNIEMGENLTAKAYGSSPRIIKFIALVIIAPVLETFFYQFVPYLVCKKQCSQKYFIKATIISSSILFGIAHFYSLTYIIYAFSVGLVFIFSFLSRIEKGDEFSTVISVHALVNCAAFIEEMYNR